MGPKTRRGNLIAWGAVLTPLVIILLAARPSVDPPLFRVGQRIVFQGTPYKIARVEPGSSGWLEIGAQESVYLLDDGSGAAPIHVGERSLLRDTRSAATDPVPLPRAIESSEFSDEEGLPPAGAR